MSEIVRISSAPACEIKIPTRSGKRDGRFLGHCADADIVSCRVARLGERTGRIFWWHGDSVPWAALNRSNARCCHFDRVLRETVVRSISDPTRTTLRTGSRLSVIGRSRLYGQCCRGCFPAASTVSTSRRKPLASGLDRSQRRRCGEGLARRSGSKSGRLGVRLRASAAVRCRSPAT